VKQNATLDSSFWINAAAGGLLDYLLEDFALYIVPAVERELPETYPSGARLHRLLTEGRVTLAAPEVIALEQFGPGEREAISLAAQHREWTLLLDDLRPFRAAVEMGLTPISTPAYAASLYGRRVLDRGWGPDGSGSAGCSRHSEPAAHCPGLGSDSDDIERAEVNQ
jgi:hypothetical protein